MIAVRALMCGVAAGFALASALPALADMPFERRQVASAPLDLRPPAAAFAAGLDLDASPALPLKADPLLLLPRPAETKRKTRKHLAAVPLPRPNPRRALAVLPDPLPPAPDGIVTGSTVAAAPPPPPPPPVSPQVTDVTGASQAPQAASAAIARPSEPVATPSIAIPANAPPFELVRILQLTQDRIAAGSTDALAAQRDLFARIDAAFAAAPPAVWQEPRNAAAAVTYVLSGGPPNVLKRILALKTPPGIDDKLVRGALAYVEGREAEAIQYLGDIDATALPESMSGQTALAQAALALRADPARAIILLDTARLVAPGTLVEEAALRREIFLADQTGDEDKFEQLTRSYLQRFRHSVYAGNFRNRFEAALSHTRLLDAPDKFARIQAMLEEVEPAGRAELYLTVARAAAVQAKLPVAILAAEEARTLAEPGSVEEARALLYGTAAFVVTKDGLEKALTGLKSVDRSKLSLSDQLLFDSVSRVVGAIRDANAHPGSSAFAEAALTGAFDKVPATATKAVEALRATDVLAKEKS